MTSQHQLEREYTFTSDELRYLQTTQRLALERMQGIFETRGKQLTEAERQVRDDLYAFGLEVEESLIVYKARHLIVYKARLSIKMGVIYWLIGIWHPLFDETAQQPVFIEHDVMFTRSKVERIHQMLLKDYIDYANDK